MEHALLDHIESTVEDASSTSNSHTAPTSLPANYPRRHRGWWNTRERTRAAIAATFPPKARLLAWDNCGRRLLVLRNKHRPNTYKLTSAGCHDRFCKPCQAARTTTIQKNLRSRMADHPYRLLTLTLLASTVPLREQLTRLYTCFRKLRQTKTWKQRVTGGAAFLEITLNDATQKWHPHLHLILEGKYYPQEQLSRDWFKLTGDSKVVDIRLISNRNAACIYVTKYCTKAHDHRITRNPEPFAELIQAVKSRKLIMPFGTWRKWKLTAKLDDPDWEYLGPLDELFDCKFCTRDEASLIDITLRHIPEVTDGTEFSTDTS
jgi:hypothetical protein